MNALVQVDGVLPSDNLSDGVAFLPSHEFFSMSYLAYTLTRVAHLVPSHISTTVLSHSLQLIFHSRMLQC
jgi:hypothetical protein